MIGNGQYIFGLIDQFAASYSLFVVIFFEFVGIAWFFGVKKILWYQSGEIVVTKASNLISRLRSNPWFKGFTLTFWSISWIVVAPFVMILIFSGSVVFQFIERPEYTAFQNYSQVQVEYPTWSLFVIVFIILSTLIPVPLGMIYEYKEFWHMIKSSCFALRRGIIQMSYKLGITNKHYYSVVDQKVTYSADGDSVSLIRSDKMD